MFLNSKHLFIISKYWNGKLSLKDHAGKEKVQRTDPEVETHCQPHNLLECQEHPSLGWRMHLFAWTRLLKLSEDFREPIGIWFQQGHWDDPMRVTEKGNARLVMSFRHRGRLMSYTDPPHRAMWVINIAWANL